MNKITLCWMVVFLIMYLALVFCDEIETVSEEVKDLDIVNNGGTDLMDEARTRRRHRFHHLWGWHALAIAYWIKVKVVIVSFFLGSALFLGLRYFWPHKCNSEMVHEGPIIYENPHSFSASFHDHIPYSSDHDHHFDHGGHSFDHSFDSSSFEPYSAYSSGFTDFEATGVTSPGVLPSTAPDTHRIGRKRRSVRQRQPQQIEAQMAEVMFAFLGLDSKACRRRFVCEMEFRSKENPFSEMMFRIIGRGFFDKYTNAHNEQGQATSFLECAAVNPECVFIEQSPDETEDNENTSEPETTEIEHTNVEHTENEAENSAANLVENSVDEENNMDMEEQNAENLKDERHKVNIKQRRRGDRHLKAVADFILQQQQQQQQTQSDSQISS